MGSAVRGLSIGAINITVHISGMTLVNIFGPLTEHYLQPISETSGLFSMSKFAYNFVSRFSELSCC